MRRLFRTGSGWYGDILHAAVCTGTDRILRRRTRQAAKWQCFLSGDSIAAVAPDRIFSRKIPSGAVFEGKEQTRARIQQTSFIKEIEKWTAPLQSQMPQIASGGVSEGTINDADFS